MTPAQRRGAEIRRFIHRRRSLWHETQDIHVELLRDPAVFRLTGGDSSRTAMPESSAAWDGMRKAAAS